MSPHLSIIIPSYQEPYLINTLESILDNAQGNIDIFVNVDDGTPINFTRNDPRVTFNYPAKPLGMRGGVNLGITKTHGNYIMKCDAHCVFAPGFDTEIIKNMEENWLVVPRRYSLYADGWKKDPRFPPKDYHYIAYPANTRFYGHAMFPHDWKTRGIERTNINIDDTMTLQGSCYIVNRKYFMNHLGFLDDNPDTYTSFGAEQLEISLKYWLKGGQVKVNKLTWYAHLFKNSRYYHEIAGSVSRKHKVGIKAKGSWSWSTKHWLTNQEPGQIHSFSWLVERFWPVPTWPEDRSLWLLT